MGVHRNPKSEEDLILDDKLDLLRTLTTLEGRKRRRRILNDIEPSLVEAHAEELASGTVTAIDFDLAAIFRKQIDPGDKAA